MKKLIILLTFLTVLVTSAETVTVNLGSEKQTIRGFGGMTHRVWTGYDLSNSDRDKAFGNGPQQMGMTVLRVWISDNESQWSLELPSAKDVIARGGIVYASPWNPPASLRTPYTLVRWGTSYNTHKVSASNYAAYAAHLNKFAKYMKDNGAPLYAISFQNEPDWCDSWTCWDPGEIYQFTKNHAATLRMHGTKVITAESFSYAKNIYDQVINDASALANIDIIGAHFYGSTAASANSFFQYPLADQKAKNKERWMTEHYTDSKGDANMWRGYIITGDQDQKPTYDTVRALDVAYEIHRGLVEGNFNQYTWWYIRRDYGLIKHSGAGAGDITKRGYCMAQYSKFIRPGFVRVDATKNPDPQVYVSAYKKADSVVIVVINRDRNAEKNISFSVPEGKAISSWQRFTTSETKSLKSDGPVSATNGSFSLSLDKESVTTIVGTGAAPVAPEERAPYLGSPAVFPGKIEAENYDLGGAGVAYYDEDAENKGGVYRTDGVDITGDAQTGYQVGWTVTGEWLEYTVDVTVAQRYQWDARVASGGDNASFRLLLDGVDITGLAEVPNTGSWETFTSIKGNTPLLSKGKHVLRLLVEGSYFNIDWIEFKEESTNIQFTSSPNLLSQSYEVYDLQGKRLGIIASEFHSLESSIKNQFHRSGLFLVKQGSSIHKVLVKQ